MSIATTKMSSKGQIVIPEEIRTALGLKEGSQFVVIGKGDAVVLKAINPPRMEQFEQLLKEARKSARRVGLKKSDVAKAIKQVRRQKSSK